MKAFSPYISAALLVGYAVFTAFTDVTIAHAIILASLASLYAWNQFLLARETPSLESSLAKLKSELEQQMEKQKELHEKRFSDLDGELTKIAMSHLKPVSPSTSNRPADANKKTYIF